MLEENGGAAPLELGGGVAEEVDAGEAVLTKVIDVFGGALPFVAGSIEGTFGVVEDNGATGREEIEIDNVLSGLGAIAAGAVRAVNDDKVELPAFKNGAEVVVGGTHEVKGDVFGDTGLKNAKPGFAAFDADDFRGPLHPPQGGMARAEFENAFAGVIFAGEKIEGGIGVPWNGVAVAIDRSGLQRAAEMTGAFREKNGCEKSGSEIAQEDVDREWERLLEPLSQSRVGSPVSH